VTGVSLFLSGDIRRKMVLRDLDLTLRESEHCAFIGPNGSRKSTLLRLLGGEIWPARGNIRWHTNEVAETSSLADKAMSALVSLVRTER
jgi:ABC-type cobalamin/Fe3+-siderophores transport system ATPase subunit